MADVTARLGVPKWWRQYESILSGRAELGNWPGWCYCPLAGAHAIASQGGTLTLDRAHLIAELGAVAAWRPTKGVYRFDPELAAALTSTPLDRELPGDILTHLPEWCVWVDPTAATPGFFAHLEFDANDRRRELRLLVDLPQRLVPAIVHIDRGTLADGVKVALLEGVATQALATGRAVPAPPDGLGGRLAASVAPLVSLLLYLCSDGTDYGDREPPIHPSSRRRPATAQGETVWTVGERLGAALRAGSDPERGDPGEGSHAAPRAHVRRAHWHLYWTGKGRAEPRVRWLHPILVGAGETVPTVHK